MATIEKPRYFMVAEGSVLKPFNVEVSESYYKCDLPGLRGFRVADSEPIGPADILKEGKIPENSPIKGLSSGTILSVQKGNAYRIITETERRRHSEEAPKERVNDVWETMAKSENMLNEEESAIIGRIVDEYVSSFMNPADGRYSALAKALINEKDGVPATKKDILANLHDTRLPIEEEDVRMMGGIIEDLEPQMSKDQIKFTNEIMGALRGRRIRHRGGM
jgi:hypothetical protein